MTATTRHSRRSARQLWNALLHLWTTEVARYGLSQSPSILKCSSAGSRCHRVRHFCVAVPVNYGMLSYAISSNERGMPDRRSPRQLWNALLLLADLGCIKNLSQSPSIIECSPTNHCIMIDVLIASQSPSIMECSPTMTA